MKQPLISVIMPAHNTERFIGAAIESVLAQTYENWELLVIDDASTDGTGQVVRRFSDTRIKYHRCERIGHPAGVRNVGLRLAQGVLIAFLDSDDLYFPDTLAKLSRPLIKNPGLIAVYGFATHIDEQDRPLAPAIPLAPRKNAKPGEPAYYLNPRYTHSWENIVTSHISCLLSALMLRREAREAIGFFNESLYSAEDYEFYVRMFLHNYNQVKCLSDYVYQYRLHTGGMTKRPEHYEKVLNSCLRIFQWLFDEAPIPEHVKRYRSKAYVHCYRYLARERLLNAQPSLARQIILKAAKEQNIRFSDFMQVCGPLLLRTLWPTAWDQALVRTRQTLRHWKTIYFPTQQPLGKECSQ